MKDLKNIDIITINCTNTHAGIMAIKHCQKYFNFGRAIMFTHDEIVADTIEIIKIKKLNSVNEYNDFVLRLNQFINNEFVLVVQDDGFIINQNKWDDLFLNYDYIGAPWSSHEDSAWIELQNQNIRQYMYENLKHTIFCNGGFSLRSNKFLKYSSQFTTCNGIGEDSFLNIVNNNKANEFGIKHPPFELALKFSYENAFIGDEMKIRDVNRVNYNPENHFGFHGHNFLNSNELINLKFNNE